MVLAHALTDANWRFLEVDDAFMELLERSRQDLTSLDFLAVTHLHDRSHNRRKNIRLREDGSPFVIIKRYVLPDQSSVWVENHVSAFGNGGDGCLIASVRALDDHEVGLARPRAPVELTDELSGHLSHELGIKARAIQRARYRGRASLTSAIMNTPAYDMLLELVASEVEGRPVDVTALTAVADVASATGVRWTSLLEKRGLVETTRGTTDRRRRMVRLTDDGWSVMTRYLSLDGL